MIKSLRSARQILFLTLCVFLMLIDTGCRSCNTPKGTGAEVHGLVYADVPENTAPPSGRQVFIPGVTVFLKNSSTKAISPKVATNIRGWYAIPHMPAGKYQICWEADGYSSGCTLGREDILIESSNVTPLPLKVTPLSPTLVGRALFHGNMPCLAQDPFFGLNSVTKATLIDSSGNPAHAAVVANSSGDFVIPSIPSSGTFRIRVECDGITTESAVPAAGSNAPLNLEIPNANPTISSIVAGEGHSPIRRAPPGAIVPVRVVIQDASNRHLHYRWFSGDPSPTFISRDAPTVEWKLANARALNTLYVLVSDEKGGHSIGQVNVISGRPEVVFSGAVVDVAGTVISGATVSINGHNTTTNAQGYFFVQLSAARSLTM